MAFWRTWSWDASAIDTLLDSEDVTLVQLLDENDILTEAKAQNKKLLDFILQDENLKQFLSFVTEEHPELTEETKYKYPYIVCEILCTDIQCIYEAIFAKDEFLDKILNFWTQPANHLLAGYVNRITGCFLAKRKAEVVNFLKEKDNFVEKTLAQLEETNVVDLLLKLIASDEIDVPTISWLSECDILRRILEKYDNSLSPLIHENVSQLLSGIIVISAQNISSGGDCRLLRQLEEEEIVEELASKIFSGPQSSTLFYGSSVIIELIRQSSTDLYDFETSLEDLPFIIQTITSYGNTLNEYLTTTPLNDVPTTFGTLSPPLGPHRLKVVEILGMLVNARFITVYTSLLDTPLLSTLMDLFFQYEWNSFLHSVVSRIIAVILESNDSEATLKLFSQTNLHSRIAKVGLLDINSFNGNGYQRRGYMGFVTTLTSTIQVSAQVNEELAQLLQQHPDWQKYLQSTFLEAEEIQNRAIGGVAGVESSEEEEQEQLLQFQHIVKRDFENEFPDNFAVGDFEDRSLDKLIHPVDGNFVGILCEEPGFGEEFDSDEEIHI